MSLLLLFDNPFLPYDLFRANEQGIWLDPSDFSTLFQDASGTTPVTAVGQPVGLALDKRLGLALGSEKITSQDLTNAAWVSGGAFGNWAGSTATATTITTTGTDGARRFRFPCTPGQAFKATCSAVKGGTATGASINIIFGTAAAALIDGSITSATNLEASSAPLQVYGIAPATAAFCEIVIRATGASGSQATFTDISVREIAGNHAYQTTLAARPTLQQDSNGLYYLSFDGTDDGMATAAINFTGTDKVTVWTGVRKLSDAATGTVVEFSANTGLNNGAFVVYAPLTAAANYAFGSRGTSAGTVSAVTTDIYASPNTSVLTAIGDISGDISRVRVSGATTTTTTDQGTGNYGNYPLYIGSRGGTSLPFNGRIYGLIVRGAASNAGQIVAAEQYMNSKTRAY